MKEENLSELIKDDVIDVNTLLEYFLERFKMILLTSCGKNSVKSLERLFNIIIQVKKAQLIKMHITDIETNP